MDHAVLKIVKTADQSSAKRLAGLCASLSCGQTALETSTFWAVAAGFFESMALGLLPDDVYSKRTASRILQQYAVLSKGGSLPSERLAHDLVFFSSLCGPRAGQVAPLLSAVRNAYSLNNDHVVDYETEQFGRFDPAQLALARKRIASAAESWSALAGGETNRLKVVADQFAAVNESIVKLHSESSPLATAMGHAVDATVRSGEPPKASVAMEVATSILYLEAAYEDLDPTANHMAERSARLALRLQYVCAGAEPEPLESWMEDLYRRVSDRQTMGSVVDELRASLSEVEGSLDQFFRNPVDKAPLREVPSRLSQMRGVFSVLGLDQPSLAALRMRSSVEQLLVDDIDVESARSGIFEKLGNSLGAMGFLIDMLSYQRAMAKKLFVYDETLGEFRPLMGRERAAPQLVQPEFVPEFEVSLPQVQESPVLQAQTPALASANDEPDDDEDMQAIFLEEARDVVRNGLTAARALAADPSNLADQTTIRRAFHTLKGSARMVGLNDFGEAAWSFEQLFNTWLAEQKPASDELITLSGDALQAFGLWVEDIDSHSDAEWSSLEFRKASDAMRLESTLVPLRLPGLPDAPISASLADSPQDFASTQMVEFPLAALPAEPQPVFESTRLVDTLDFGDAKPIANPDQRPEFESTQLVSSLLEPELEDRVDFENTRSAGIDAFQTFENSQQPSEAAVEPATAEDDGLADGLPSEPDNFDLGDFDFPEPDSAKFADPDLTVDTPASDVADQDAMSEHSATVGTDVEAGELDFPPEGKSSEAAEIGSDEAPEEQVKVIGNLRLSIPFYNVYLNEADEWSRRLQTELSEWAMELHRPIQDSTVALAHSLLGSSATVGFAALSDVARALEHALEHVKLHAQGTAAHATVFNNAAEDIRRLLHQFAAGFLKEPNELVLSDLKHIIDTEFLAPTAESSELLQDESDSQDNLETQMPSLDPGLDDEFAVFANTTDVENSLAEAPEPVAGLIAPDFMAVPAPLKVAAATDEEIDAENDLDPDLLPVFQEEAIELMPALGSALRQWASRPDNNSARGESLRVLHTLKGSARLAGAMRLGEMAHRMESSIEELGSENLQPLQVEPLLTRFDALQVALDSLGREATPLEGIESKKPATGEQAESLDASAAPAPRDIAAIKLAASSAAVAPVRTLTSQSVRVRSQLLDRLVNQAGEVMISRSRMDARVGQLRSSLGELGGNLDRLRQQLRDVELQAESQMQSRMAQTKDSAQTFDPLEFDRFTRVQELTRMMAESVNDVATVQRNLQRAVEGAEDDLIAQGRQARELQRDLLRTRMVEFEGVSDRLYGVVRQASKEAGKQVRLDIVGGSIEMDRGVLDRMIPAFEHILRNAVAHGIEETSERIAAGKPAAGTITIAVNQESNDVSVAFSDDGGGLHLERIRAKAISSKLLEEGQELSLADAAALLFSPGFSTAEQVTELSGRGIGMDVVMSEVNALGGRIETTSNQGEGTRFKLVLPLTTAVTQVVMLRMGEFTIGVPSNLMETVLRAPAEALASGYATDVFDVAGQSVPFFWAGALLQLSGSSTEPAAKYYPVAVFRSAGQRLALHVDEVLGNREVVVKNLGPQLARLAGLAGMSVLASGAVVLIYNPVALATVYGESARLLQAAAKSGASTREPVGSYTSTGIGNLQAKLGAVSEQLPLVLVVDDSITVRRVTQRLLKREGFRVTLANDGLHALEKLQEEKPAVVLSDIEMPRMDGFDLVRNIRNDAALADLPVIMITSRIAQKHRDHANALGVDHYLGKPYSEDELLGLIRDYCKVATDV
jgi:chemosensory pili system protein ChpA (sensor histidine kinase/response regulator)